jgi:hypothetical protein
MTETKEEPRSIYAPIEEVPLQKVVIWGFVLILVVALQHFYPLFQQAYQELGYPKGHFNDRLVDVIDHLLAAPEVTAPVKLVRPKVFYLFADPALEARSAGQKILMRVGSENAALIKAKLRDIRGELTRQVSKR